MCIRDRIEVVDLFVRADVERTDDDRTVAHLLCDLSVCIELKFLGRPVLAFQIQELTAEQADALSIVGQHGGCVRGTADVGVQVDPLTGLGFGGLALELPQEA